ncbi:MAG: hypothetical protein ABEJ67_02595 [Halanaeroarchaeum sp.]
MLAATAAAYTAPAVSYELSVYGGTPDLFWAGVSIAVTASLAVAMANVRTQPLREVSLLLGGASVTTVVVLPLIRGYYQFGSEDSLTHLGWTRDIVAGRLDPVSMLYPGVHLMTILVGEVLGARFGRAQMLVVVAFVLVFLVFVPKCVDILGRTAWAVPVGAFSAFLLLPNNNVSVHLMIHPISQTLFFLPFILYLLLFHVSGTDEPTARLDVATPMGALLALSAVALVVLHPQGALNVIAVLLTVAGAQFLIRRLDVENPIARHRPVYVPTAIALVAFLLWAPRHPRVQGTVDAVVTGLLQGSTPADEIAQRSASLDILGAGIAVLFTKLFIVSAVVCLVAGLVVLAWWTGRLNARNSLVEYVVVSLVPLSAAFAVFFASSMTTQHFRYVGFLMVPVTILGALGISNGAAHLHRRLGSTRTKVALVVVFLLLIPLPLATVHASPFIYRPSPDVTRSELSGFETTVEYMDHDIPFVGIRKGPRRQLDGIYGTVGSAEMDLRGETAAIPEQVFTTNVTTHYDSRRYVPVSRSTYQREVVLYDGFRYPASAFERLRTGVGVDRVQTNGAYRLYLLGNESAT